MNAGRSRVVGAVLVAVLLVGACGDDSSSSTSPEESGELGPSATSPTEGDATPIGEAADGHLRAGREYRTTEFPVDLRFTAPVDLFATDLPFLTLLQVDPGDAVSRPVMAFFDLSHFTTIDDPFASNAVLTGPDRASHARPIPTDVIGWLSSLPGVQASEPTPVTFGEWSGQTFDYTVAGLPAEAEGICPTKCQTFLLGTDVSEDIVLVEGHGGRFYAITRGDETILFGFDAVAPETTSFASTADSLVASLTIG